MTADQVAALRRLYGPTSRQIRDQLPEIGDGLRDRLRTLERAPDLALIDQIIRDASGLPVLLMKLRQVLQDEAAGGSPVP